MLRHCSRAVLHGIHSVFPPPNVTGHNGADPVSVKKLLKGEGVWAVRKEIPGWTIDGATMCIELSEKTGRYLGGPETGFKEKARIEIQEI